MPWQVTIAAGHSNIELPDGGHYDAGDVVTLTDDQYARLDQNAIGSVLTATQVGGQSGTSVAATDFTTETVPDPIRGGDATMQCLVLPADQPVLAVKVAGDAFPRWVLSGHGSLALGDGTFDPVNNGANLSSSTNGSDTDLYMTSGGAGIVNVNADLRMGYSHGYGLILFAPDNSMHRINVANDGTLSTEPVA
jgi:hypothetical protein